MSNDVAAEEVPAEIRRGNHFAKVGRGPRLPPVAALIAFAVGAGALLLDAMLRRLGPELADDGAFFLRYAENMTHGAFWVWNLHGPHVWGASDPLWPLVLSVPLFFGAPPLGAVVATSMVLSLIALVSVAVVVAHRVGIPAAGAIVGFAALDTGLMYYSGAGLETPLTLVLLSAVVVCLLLSPPRWVIGGVAGLLMVNKIDLIPAALFFLVAYGLSQRAIPRLAITVAGAISGVWYLFAWVYFGSPVPNSFLTKAFHQNNFPGSLTWKWYGKLVLLDGMHKWLTVLFCVGIIYAAIRRITLMVFLTGLVVVDVIAYSIKYPFEPYNWYAMPAVFALIVGAALGVEGIGRLLTRAIHLTPRSAAGVFVRVGVGVALVAAIAAPDRHYEDLLTAATKSFSANQERDRADAGRWVAAHTPADFVVYTLWGNPAVYSNRYVIDGSFLNFPYRSGDVVAEDHPDVLILENNPGSTPSHPIFAFDTAHYKLVKIFDVTYMHSMDYFFAVFVRQDELGRLH